MDLFEKQWASYRAVVEHDLMEHQAVADATAAAPQLVDLGCGDLALLAPLLRRLPLGSYTGLDLTPAVATPGQSGPGHCALPNPLAGG
jgi:trans-aconitate methyltransferase